MRWFSAKTFLETLNQVFINLTAAWFAISLVFPGIFGVGTIQEYIRLLIQSFPFGIVGLIVCSVLSEKIKSI